MSFVLVTNVTQYAGPGAVDGLLAEGHHVLCHDPSFTDDQAREEFESRAGSITALAGQIPEEIHLEVQRRFGVPDAIVSNDAHPIARKDIETIPVDDFGATFDAVVLKPIQLTQLFLPAMKARRRGSFVFVTSAREARPEPGYAVPTTLRAATTAFAKALAIEVAPFGIQSNVVAPNYLYSELYYPRASFVDDPSGREAIAALVPFGRLGEQSEIGALIAFLASGRAAFMTGQMVHFTGGWS
ncbi:SDR family oxidoreductase [Novosphingobium terrae]|uniref:SDR family oxidoreductase n=1 Tax=Novosphingobium terrae TaxID=2726189 RepID=UPI00197E0D81|nr:SDR family oxidoreductase [Novosphingobium terrae]